MLTRRENIRLLLLRQTDRPTIAVVSGERDTSTRAAARQPPSVTDAPSLQLAPISATSFVFMYVVCSSCSRERLARWTDSGSIDRVSECENELPPSELDPAAALRVLFKAFLG